MPAHSRPSPRRMPGESRRPPAAMNGYLVLLQEEDEALRGGRKAVVEANLERSASFRRDLLEFLDEQGLCDEVASVAPPSPLPTLALTCTPRVAERVGTLPAVEAVVRDCDDIKIAE